MADLPIGKLPVFVFAFALILAGANDVLTRRIPNTLTIGMVLCFLPLALSSGLTGWELLQHMLASCVLLLLGYGLFSLGFMGGGDAKLMAAAGLWLGALSSVVFVLFTMLCGGVLAAAIGCWFMARGEIGMRSRTADRMLSRVSPDVPYGFAFAAGAILATPYSWMTVATAGPT